MLSLRGWHSDITHQEGAQTDGNLGYSNNWMVNCDVGNFCAQSANKIIIILFIEGVNSRSFSVCSR